MSNIYLKVTIDTFLELRFSGFKKFVTRSVWGCPNSRRYHIQTSGSETVGGFSITLILKGVMTF